MVIKNPQNDFVPEIGQLVKIVGGCAGWALNQLTLVESIQENHFTGWMIFNNELVTTGGELGGLEPIGDKELILDFLKKVRLTKD